MSLTQDEIFRAALLLSYDELCELLEELRASLFPQPTLVVSGNPLSHEWLTVIRRRSEEIDAGRMTCSPAEEVFQRVREQVCGKE